MADSLVGKRLGQYEITALLGNGGMADVYRAQQTSMKREVAMKVLSQTLTRDANFVARFEREVELVANLEHAHIVPVYEHATIDNVTFLTMRLIKGGTLTDLLRQGPLPLDRINAILQQIAGALDYAHERGVIHRDIKPSNVLIDEQGNAYLADFGLARTIEPSFAKTLTEPGAMVGTPTYISPEQIQEGHGDTRSDLYSLGVVLYEMVTGRPPFTGDSIFSIMQAHLFKAPPKLAEFRPGLPPAIEAVLEKALHKKPEHRYQSATALAADFNAAVQGAIVTPLPIRLDGQLGLNPISTITNSLTRIVFRQPRARLLVFGAALVALIFSVLVVVPRLNGRVSTAFADEAQRPQTGTPDLISLSQDEIARARARLEGSFIGVMACTLETEWHASFVRGAVTRAGALNLPVKLEDSRREPFRQPAILNSFIAQGAKALVICPLDEAALVTAVQAAQEANIPVASAGDTVYGALSVTFTLTNEEMGRRVGEYAALIINRELSGKAVVAVLDYPPLPQVQVRANAMEAALRDKAPGARIVGRWQGGVAEDGAKGIAEALAKFPDINVILSINDAGAFGAVNALRAAGKKPDEVMIFSIDAEAQARRMISAGEYFRATLDNDPAGTSALAIDSVVKMLAGGIVPRQVLVSGKMITRDTVTAPTVTP